MTAGHPLDWIGEIDSALAALDEKPQFGNVPPLDWSQLEKNLREFFNKPSLKISHHAKGWIASHHLLDGMGKEVMPLSIVWQPLREPSLFVTDRSNLERLLIEMLETEEGARFFYESPLMQGFYFYFAAELLRQLEKLRFSFPLTPQLGPEIKKIDELIGEQSCFVFDLTLTIEDKNFSGRILLPANFRREWKTYFNRLPPSSLSEGMKRKLMVDVGLEIAHSHLALDEWKGIKKGDWIVLDYCSYNPTEHKGAVMLKLDQKPIFRGRIKDGEIKITNYPVYEEVSDVMEEKPFGNEDEDSDLYSDFEDSELEDENLFADLEEEKPAMGGSASQPAAEKAQPENKPISFSIEELPIHLTVEVGRLRLTAGELMNLAPGNLLDLNVSPEQGVDLVLNGKKVGQGELVRIGDVLGVRILSL